MPNIPQPILDAIRDNRLILWVGAGFSQHRLGLPSWRGLVDELADACLSAAEAAKLKSQLDSKALTEVQALESLRPHAEKCHRVIHDRFDLHMDSWDARLDDFHLLWQISHKIITTNYDTGLDLTLPGSVPPVVYDKKYQRKRIIENQKFYFKLHGSASEPENCILFEQQYQDLYRDTSDAKLTALSDEETPAKFLLKHLLSNHVILFIGFGIEERVDFVLEYIHHLLGGIEHPKYTLIQKDKPDTWPHTERLEISDFAEIPGFLRLLAQKKAEYNPTIDLGDKAMSFDRAYVGRDAEVDAVENFFNGTVNFFFLSGAGGMGKSHLLDTVLQRLPPGKQPVYFRIERHYTMLTITQKLGIEPLPPAPKNQPNQHLLKVLEQLERPLVFDDFYEISDPELFYTLLELPKWRGIKSLLISRSLPPDWAKFNLNVQHRELRELDRPAFDACLRGLTVQMPAFENVPLTPQQLDTCWQLCGGYPLGGHLLLSLFGEPDFDPMYIERLDLDSDPSRSHFVGDLLDVILKKGSETERSLAREIAVFAEPVPKEALATLPSWNSNQIAFFALWHRKGLIFRRKADNLYGMHALVRSIILQKLGESPEARACAGRYYESITGLSEMERVVALQKALEHYDRGPDEGVLFREKMFAEFVGVEARSLIDEQSESLTIERLMFRLRLNPDEIDCKYELGNAYRRQGNLSKSIALMEEFLIIHPGNPSLITTLGSSLRGSGQKERAIEVLRETAEAGFIPAVNLLANLLRETGQSDKAIEILQNAITLHPEDPILKNNLGFIFREAGLWERAIEVHQKAADSGHIYSVLELGITLRLAGQFDRAIEVHQKTAETGNLEIASEFGITLHQAGQLDKAIEVLQKASDSGSLRSADELSKILRNEGRLDNAIEVLQKSMEAGNGQFANELSIALSQAGRLDEAIEVLQKTVDSGHNRFSNQLGITLRQAGRLDEAIEVLQKAAELYPNSVTIHSQLGITLKEAGHYEKALEVLKQAANLASDNINSLIDLGIILREAKQYDKAIEVFEKVVVLDTWNVIPLYELGITHRKAGQSKKAQEVLQKATELQPTNVIVLNELGITLRESGQRDEAIEALQKAVDAGHVHSMNELGITLRESGQRDNAIEVLQKAAELQPGNVILLNELGITLRESGQRDKAIEVLQKAVDAGNIHAMNELGITLRESGQRDKAIEILKKGLKKRPTNTYLKHNLLQIYLFFKPNKSDAAPLMTEAYTYLKGGALKIYEPIFEQLDYILKYEASELTQYRPYLNQLFRLKSWHFAVEYLSGLVLKHPRGEYKAKLGEALCQPIIGRSQEGIPLLREAVEELSLKPQLSIYFQQTTMVLLEVMSLKGKKEFKRAYERFEPKLRGYAPFEEKRTEWERLLA